MARGSLKQRSPGSWQLRVELEPDPATGKRRQKATTHRGTKKAAQTALAKLVLDAEEGAIGNAGGLSVAGFLARYLEEHARADRAAKTYATYSAVIRNQIIPVLGTVPLEKLRPHHGLDFKAALRAMPAKHGKRRPLSPARQWLAFVVLKGALQRAVEWRLLARNPLAGIPAPTVPRTEMHPYSAEQATAFLGAAAAGEVCWHAFFAVALNTGCRLGELVGLRWDDLKLDVRTLSVVQTIAWVDGLTTDPDGTRRGGWVVKAPKTKAGRRTIPLGPELVALLRRHRAAQLVGRVACGPRWHDNGLVFPSAVGTPLPAATVRARLTRIAEEAGVPRIRVHDLRHSTASILMEAGTDIAYIQELLRHTDIRMTRRYSHIRPTSTVTADTMAAALTPRAELEEDAR